MTAKSVLLSHQGLRSRALPPLTTPPCYATEYSKLTLMSHSSVLTEMEVKVNTLKRQNGRVD